MQAEDYHNGIPYEEEQPEINESLLPQNYCNVHQVSYSSRCPLCVQTENIYEKI